MLMNRKSDDNRFPLSKPLDPHRPVGTTRHGCIIISLFLQKLCYKLGALTLRNEGRGISQRESNQGLCICIMGDEEFVKFGFRTSCFCVSFYILAVFPLSCLHPSVVSVQKYITADPL